MIAAYRMKVHRGQVGRVLAGYSTGGRCFGYRSVMENTPADSSGNTIAAGVKWEVVEDEAKTILRIYELFADGLGAGKIARLLNDEKVPGPSKSRIAASESTWNINRVSRILRNEKYRGVVVWNRTTKVIHPGTGKVEVRMNPIEAIIRVDVPHLRIVPDELWGRVQSRLLPTN
jgi:site-specific DNA recombinase